MRNRPAFPPFTNNAKCPKCGDDDIKTKYVDSESDTLHTYRTVEVRPYVIRTCPCQYWWAEEAKDYASAATTNTTEKDND